MVLRIKILFKLMNHYFRVRLFDIKFVQYVFDEYDTTGNVNTPETFLEKWKRLPFMICPVSDF